MEQVEKGNLDHPDPPFYVEPHKDKLSVEDRLTGMLKLYPLTAEDIEPIAESFAAIGWNKPAAQYARYLAEQEQGTRHVLVAFVDGAFAGYLTVVWRSDYPGFQALGDADFKINLTDKVFTNVVATFSPRLKNGYSTEYLGSLRKLGYTVHLWKITFKDEGDDVLCEVSLKEQKVGGFFLR